MEKNAYIVSGLPGSGKSYFAGAFAKKNKIPFFDPDLEKGYLLSTYLKKNEISSSFVTPLMHTSRRERLLFRKKYQDYQIKYFIFQENRINCFDNNILRYIKNTENGTFLTIMFEPFELPQKDEYDQIEFLEVKNYLVENTTNKELPLIFAMNLISSAYKKQNTDELKKAITLYENALEELKQIFGEQELKKSLLLIVLIQMSRCLSLLRANRKCIEVLEKAYKIDQTYKVTLLHLLKAYLFAGDFEKIALMTGDNTDKNLFLERLKQLAELNYWTINEIKMIKNFLECQKKRAGY